MLVVLEKLGVRQRLTNFRWLWRQDAIQHVHTAPNAAYCGNRRILAAQQPGLRPQRNARRHR